MGTKIVHIDVNRSTSLVLNDIKTACMYLPPGAKIKQAVTEGPILTIEFNWS